MFASENRIHHHIQELSKFTETPGEGVTRLTYSKEDMQARQYIKEKMIEYGLQVHEDGIGNIFGKLEGSKKEAPSVLIGSHFDSVPHGGAYDGTAGVVVGLEIAALFQENNIAPQYPLEIIAMIEEEGTRFGDAMMGSRSIAGNISDEDLDSIQDKQGVSIREAMRECHLDSSLPRKRDSDTLKAFIEMHIEQGPILESKQLPVGIVQSIVGLTQLDVVIKGQAGHAGTTPMHNRSDALITASSIITELPDIAKKESEDSVITTGTLQVYPNGANVIPGEVTFTVDIRSSQDQHVKNMIVEVKELVKQFQRNGIQVDIKQKTYIKPKALDPTIQQLLIDKSEKLNLEHCFMNSGAGHDAMVLSDITKAGMIFIPSENGLSHCPEEYSETYDIANSVDVIFESVKELTNE